MLVLASLLFISAEDALLVVARYAASVIWYRLVLEIELSIHQRSEELQSGKSCIQLQENRLVKQ